MGLKFKCNHTLVEWLRRPRRYPRNRIPTSTRRSDRNWNEKTKNRTKRQLNLWTSAKVTRSTRLEKRTPRQKHQQRRQDKAKAKIAMADEGRITFACYWLPVAAVLNWSSPVLHHPQNDEKYPILGTLTPGITLRIHVLFCTIYCISAKAQVSPPFPNSTALSRTFCCSQYTVATQHRLCAF